MNRANQLKDAGLLNAEKKRWQTITFILAAMLLLSVMTLFGKSNSTKTIFIPPTVNDANKPYSNKPFWVSDSGASPEYYQMTADYVAQLALTTDVKSAPYQVERLLAISEPSIRGTLKAELDASALKMKNDNIQQAFYPTDFYMSKDDPVVGVKGNLKTWVGDKMTSSRQVVYRIAFKQDAGRIFLTEFKESQPNDPLNLPQPAQAEGAAQQ